MIRAGLVVTAALAVTACASKTPPPQAQGLLVKHVILTRDVPRFGWIRAQAPPPAPVTKPCTVSVAAAPDYPDGAAALRSAPTIYEQVQLLLAGRALRMERERVLAESLKRCSG